jgi:hydroxymethylbilane synthase
MMKIVPREVVETQRHGPTLPLAVGTRSSPLALWQTRTFLGLIEKVCPILKQMDAFQERHIATSGDQVQDKRLADIGGKGLFAKEIHEALLDRRVDFAVHSLKDLETELPPGIVLACTLKREDPRDALVLNETCRNAPALDPETPYAVLPKGALIGTASVRRQAQLLHARPDLRVEMIRGNVQTRLKRVHSGEFDASLLAIAGLKRLELEHEAGEVIDADVMVPAAAQGIVGVTVREDDDELRELLHAIEDREARIAATAERALLHSLDGSCRTPIGAHARMLPAGMMSLTGLVARADGSFVTRRRILGAQADATRMGRELGAELLADCPADVFA